MLNCCSTNSSENDSWNTYKVPDTIKCGICGWDSGIPQGPIFMVIPPEGIKCPNGHIVIHSNTPTF